MTAQTWTRRRFLAATAAATIGARSLAASAKGPAQIAISLDLEMSAQYPQRGMTEWNYQKGNLDEATKQYALQAGELVAKQGGIVHYFCVGRVLEQPDVTWLQQLAKTHPVGNHTYDHVHLKASTLEGTQYRFQRSPWLVSGMSVEEVLRHNIRLTEVALKQRAGIEQIGFRTPGGFSNGLEDRPDLQQMLLDFGFKWVSAKYPSVETGTPMHEPTQDVYDNLVAAQAEAQPFTYASGLVEVPMSPISDVHAFRTLRWKLPWYLKAIELAVQWAIDNGGVFDFLAHPSCLVVEDPKLQAIQLICDLVRKAGPRAQIVGLHQIAAQIRDV